MVDYDDNVERKLLDDVSHENLMDYTSKVASWIRISGEPSEAESMAYIEALLSGFGYRTEMLHHPAYISVPGQASLVAASASGEPVRIKCMSHTFGVATIPEGLTARIVDSDHKDSYRGNIVLIQGMASAKAVAEAQALGSIGQVFVSDDYLHESSISPLWGAPTHQTLDRLPSTPSVTVVRKDGELLKRLMETGPVSITIYTEVKTEWRQIPLLVANLDIPGEDSFLLFSSHVDSWYYGAMDNGSANATLLETARLMAENRSSLKRGLRLALWSGHSQGRFAGSSWYCDAFWAELADKCIGHVNVDSTGGRGASIVDELPVMPQSFALAAASLKRVTGVTLEGKRMGRFGDQSFYGLGLTSTFATFSEQPLDPTGRTVRFPTGGKKSGGLGWWWHTEHDTIDKVDPDVLLRDTKVYVSAVYRILSSKYLPYDFRELADYIEQQTCRLSHEVGTKLDLTPVKHQLQELRKRLETFYDAMESGRISPDHANSTIRKLSRSLVPIAFKENERIETDPFGAIPDFPLFEGVSRLNDTDGSDFHMLQTVYVRRRNRMIDYLTQALESFGTHE